MRWVSALAALMVCGSMAQTVPITTASVDQNPPLAPDGTPIPTMLSSDSGGLCWADPTEAARVVTGEFGEMSAHRSKPHAGVDLRAPLGSPLYSVADGCVSFGNPTPRQLIGVKIRINDKFPNASVWYLHMSRVAPKFINDGRNGQCIPVKKGELVGYSGNSFGTRGNIVDIASAPHLHLSYYASGLMLNPMPYVGAPAEIPPEFNTIRGASSLVGGGTVNDSNASGTKGSKLGFAVPRMCNSYTVKHNGKKTIPYTGDYGTGTYSANATPPTQAQMEDGAQRVRQSLGVDANGMASSDQKIDANNWSGGLPEAPDWDSYAEMSLTEILRAEVARRAANSRWAEELTDQSPRGLMMENLRMRSLRLLVQYELYLSRQRANAMMASLTAIQARKMTPVWEQGSDARLKSPVR